MAKPYTSPPLSEVVSVAHEHDVPVIVDAAAELPPQSNLRTFVEQGADLVVYSGGKAIRGPQTTGILAGPKHLISSVAMQHLDMHAAAAVWDPPADLLNVENLSGVPRQGIGRPMKVGKEELVGLLVALKSFLDENHDELQARYTARAKQIRDQLESAPALTPTLSDNGRAVTPTVRVKVDEQRAACATATLVRQLRQENPRVFVDADRLHASEFSVNPMCLTDEEADYVADRILTIVEQRS